MISGLVKALAPQRGGKPESFVRAVKRKASTELGHSEHFSIFYGVIDLRSRIISFVNSGTAYPVFVKKGTARYMRLGADQSFESRSASVSISPGEIFVILTDGILNVKNPDGRKYGLKRAMKFLESGFDDADSTVNGLIKDAEAFSRGVGIREDITIFVIRAE